jgi:hypothetical protein
VIKVKNEMNELRLRIGDNVKVRSQLVVGERYFMQDRVTFDKFSKLMSKNSGAEAMVIGFERGMYVLDIDPIHTYTDDMLIKINDPFARKSYTENEEVEDFLNHMLTLTTKQLIDNALDKGDKETFKKLTENISLANKSNK